MLLDLGKSEHKMLKETQLKKKKKNNKTKNQQPNNKIPKETNQKL